MGVASSRALARESSLPDSCESTLRARSARPSASEPGSGPRRGFAATGEGTESPRILDLRRAEEIPAEPGMADPRVAEHVHDRRLARCERALERGPDLVGCRDVLAVAADRLEHAVVAEV